MEMKESSRVKDSSKVRSFSRSFTTAMPPGEVFELLLDVKKWWSGFYEESIAGRSSKKGDEFSFKAGGGAHYSKQKLIELVPQKKIAWLVTESNLTFLDKSDEWVDTKICFAISQQGGNTVVTFTHEGLTPGLECYNECSLAWGGYMEQMEQMLNKDV
jgi:hypothetical protein